MKDEEDEVVADWKFAAMVIDRYHIHILQHRAVLECGNILHFAGSA